MSEHNEPVVLTIDDEKALRDSFVNYLEDYDYRVMTAENGRKGLEVFLREKPDLVLLDLCMPEMDGLEVLAEIKKWSPETPIIIISGLGVMKDAVEALRLGAWDYLLKPIEDLTVLRYSVEKALEQLRLIRENKAYRERLEEEVVRRTRELAQANSDLQQLNQRLRRIVETTREISVFTRFDQFGSRLLEEFGRHMLASGGSLYLVEEGGLNLVHALDPGHAPNFVPFPLRKGSVTERALLSGKPMLIRDMSQLDDFYSSGWQGYGDNSVLVFPLPDEEGKVIGVLSLHSRTPPPFVEQDKEIGSILASYSCEALRASKAGEALKESEENLSITLDSIADAVIATDAEGNISRMNPAAETFTGWSLPEARGLPLAEVYHIIDAYTRVRYDNPMGKVMSLGGEVALRSHTILVSRDGRERRIAENAAPIRRKDGRIVGVVLVFRDVTEQYRLQDQVHQSGKMDAIGQLAGGVAHDFNNMLAGIIGAADLLSLKLRDNPELKKYINIVQDAGNRAADLTRKLLSFARKGKEQAAAADIHELIAGAFRILERSTDKRISIRKDFSASVSTVICDASLVENAVLNLGINARDAMPEGGDLVFSTKNVRLDARDSKRSAARLRPGLYIQVSVADSGTGMSKEIMDHIFEPFFTTKSSGKGTGLGLASVYSTVRNHQGDIQVTSKLETGTTFTILLPVDESAVLSKLVGKEEIAQGSGCILVVDDEWIIRSMAEALLTDLGYQVILAGDGKEAVEIYGKESAAIDLVLLDIIMPKMNGNDALHAMRRINPEVKVLLTSGFSRDAEKIDPAEPGIHGFIQKPFRRAELSQSVTRALLNI